MFFSSARKSKSPSPPPRPPPLPGYVRCPSCSVDIKKGANTAAGTLSQHQNKSTCVAAQKKAQKAAKNAATAKKNPVLTNFFTKKERDTPEKASNTAHTRVSAAIDLTGSSSNVSAVTFPTIGATVRESGGTQPPTMALTPQATSEARIASNPVPGMPKTACPPASAAAAPPATREETISEMIERLKACATHLPVTVPAGRPDDAIAALSGDPTLEADPTDEDGLLKTVNHALDRVFQAENRTLACPDVALLVRRGQYGIDGACVYFARCAGILGGQAGILRARIQRLIEAVESLIPSQATVAAAAIATDAVVNAARIYGSAVPASSSAEASTATAGKVRESSQQAPADFATGFRTCKGINIEIPAGMSAWTAYPFALHTKSHLPWDVHLVGAELVVQSHGCRKVVSGAHACKNCTDLLKNENLTGILFRMRHGVHINTPHIYQPHNGMVKVIERKDDALDRLRFTKLSQTRKLMRYARVLAEHKKFVLAVASGKVTRLHALVRTALRRKSSIHSIMALVDKAVQKLYKPKSYEEADFLRGLLFLRLGGARVAELAHRTFGTPAVSTLRKSVLTKPLRPSVGAPTVEDVQYNIDVSFPARQRTHQGDVNASMQFVLMLDELKITDCCRWCPETNKILGLCREHSRGITMDFETVKEIELICDALNEEQVHFATEATVAALGALCGDTRRYTARPILLSGTCKRETGPQHAELIQTTMDACKTKTADLGGRVISVASDGESRRALALEMLFLKRRIATSSPLYPLLEHLKLFNLMTGDDDVTLDKDYKHVFKRLRNTLLRENGVTIDGCRVTPQMLRRHLLDSGLSREHVNYLLNPEDKQDVVLMYTLLRALWQLPDAPPDALPTYSKVRASLKIYGRLCYYVIAPYVMLDLSLGEQLEYLSAALHLAISLYTCQDAREAFIPPGLLLDIAHMVKNAFVCIAKTKVSDPSGRFWLILLGTDRLETAFGILRTIVGNDANADLLQLGTRMSNVTECANTLADHPEWDRQPRRLRMAPMTAEGEISRDVDHINPASWRGDVSVRTVVLQTCWQLGRKRVESGFAALGVASLLTRIESISRADMLSPYGSSLVRSPEDDMDDAFGVPDADPTVSQGLDEDLEDVVGADSSTSTAVSPTIEVGEGRVKVYKARILRELLRHRAKDSVDRLRRVAKIPRYIGATTPDADDATVLGSDSLCPNDPIATLVLCEDKVFLCIGVVLAIKRDNRSVSSLSSDLLVEKTVDIRFQIIRLRSVTATDQADDCGDWRWTQQHYDGTFTTLGRFVEPVNPEVLSTSAGQAHMSFKSAEVCTLASALYGQLSKTDLNCLPTVKRTDGFPYRFEGKACFACVREGNDPTSDTLAERFCPRCEPAVAIDWKDAPSVLNHMAAHILHDPLVRDIVEPCGFCLRPSPQCTIYLRKGKGKKRGPQVDYRHSSGCERLVKFAYGPASTSKPSSPSSNVPITCPLCPERAAAVWKYNFHSHFERAHPKAPLEKYEDLFEIEGAERHGVLAIWNNRQTARIPVAKSNTSHLTVSDAHRAVLPLQSTVPNATLENPESDDEGSQELSSDDDEDVELEPGISVETVSHRGRPIKRKNMRDTCICGKQVTDEQVSENINVIRCNAPECATRWYHMDCHNFSYMPKKWKCETCSLEDQSKRAPKRRKQAD